MFVPPNKGTFYFSRLQGKGLAWYEAFFPVSLNGRVAGEVCEDYMATPRALGNIKRYRPDMRLVCCLRNPYERALSAWEFFGRNGQSEPTLARQAALRPDVFSLGYYATQLRMVRSLFDENQVLVFFFEELISNPEDVVRRLYRFVGASPDFVPSSLRRRVNGNAVPRSPTIARVVNDVHMFLSGRSRIASNVVGRVKRIRPFRKLVTTALYKARPSSLEWTARLPEFPEEVILRYEQEISSLEHMLGRDLSGWHSPQLMGQ